MLESQNRQLITSVGTRVCRFESSDEIYRHDETAIFILSFVDHIDTQTHIKLGFRLQNIEVMRHGRQQQLHGAPFITMLGGKS